MSNRGFVCASAGLAFAFLATSAQSQNESAQKAAGFIYGSVNAITAELWECGQFDKQNAVAYVNALDAYIQEVTPITSRAVTILNTEASRVGGQAPQYISNLLLQVKRKAAEEITKRREDNPASFVIECRANLDASNKHILSFMPLSEK
jgi:hypothetical protein